MTTDPHMRLVVATMKDEGPYVLEWLAYHHLIGFDHFVIFSNDCWDTTDDILTMVNDQLGFVTHVDNTDPGYGSILSTDPQRRAYLKALNMPQVRQAQYVLVIDGDEFLNIHVGAGHLDELLEAAGSFEAMSMTWRLFGSDGLRTFTDDLVLDTFAACDGMQSTQKERRLGVKTLFRPWCVEKIGVHRPFHIARIKDGSLPIRWLNGAGVEHYDYYRKLKWHATAETDGRTLAEVNHYPVKSAEAFLAKITRGSANSHDMTRIGQRYWAFYDCNDTYDRRIQRHAPAVRDTLACWFEQVPALRALHHESVARHQMIVADMKTLLNRDDPAFLAHLGLAA